MNRGMNEDTHMYIYIYIYIKVCVCIYIYKSVYIGLSRLLELRKPEYDWGVGWGGMLTFMLYTYISVYIYIFTSASLSDAVQYPQNEMLSSRNCKSSCCLK